MGDDRFPVSRTSDRASIDEHVAVIIRRTFTAILSADATNVRGVLTRIFTGTNSRGKFVSSKERHGTWVMVEMTKSLGSAGLRRDREREAVSISVYFFSVFSLDARSCKDEIYRMGIGGGYCEGNLNFATASEDDEVYTKKKVSRVSFRSVIDTFNFQFPLGNGRKGRKRRRKWTRRERG